MLAGISILAALTFSKSHLGLYSTDPFKWSACHCKLWYFARPHPVIVINSNVLWLELLIQDSTLPPAGSPMRLDLVRWQLTFHVWSPVWPPRFQVIILFNCFFISYGPWRDELMLIVNHEECTDNVISYQFHVQSRLNCLCYNNCEISYILFGWKYSGSDICSLYEIFAKRKILYHLFKQ